MDLKEYYWGYLFGLLVVCKTKTKMLLHAQVGQHLAEPLCKNNKYHYYIYLPSPLVYTDIWLLLWYSSRWRCWKMCPAKNLLKSTGVGKHNAPLNVHVHWLQYTSEIQTHCDNCLPRLFSSSLYCNIWGFSFSHSCAPSFSPKYSKEKNTKQLCTHKSDV